MHDMFFSGTWSVKDAFFIFQNFQKFKLLPFLAPFFVSRFMAAFTVLYKLRAPPGPQGHLGGDMVFVFYDWTIFGERGRVWQLDLGAFEWILSDEDIACLTAIASVLKDIVSNVFLLEGEQYPTLSMVIPMISFLKAGPFRPKPSDSPFTGECAKAQAKYL